MAGLPQLIQEDVQLMDTSLDGLLSKSEATAALIIDKGGPLVHQRGDTSKFDTTTIAALAAGSFSATQAIAERVGEKNFNNIYQQGEHHSLLVSNIDDDLLLIVIFKADQSVGVMKYYANATVEEIAAQLNRARLREPGSTMDLVSLNVMELDAASVFQKKTVSSEVVTPEQRLEIINQAIAIAVDCDCGATTIDLTEGRLVINVGSNNLPPHQPSRLVNFCAERGLQLEFVKLG